jgi:hypothetical protein
VTNSEKEIKIPKGFSETYGFDADGGIETPDPIGNEELERLVDTNKPWKLHPNEPYATRPINPNSSLDTQFYTDIDRSPEVTRWTVPSRKSKPHEVDDYVRVSDAHNEDPRKLFAVVDKQNRPMGWVQFYLDGEADWVREHAGIPDGALIIEVSYAKLDTGLKSHKWYAGRNREDFPEKQPFSVAVSGLRQSTHYLRKMEERVAKASSEPVRQVYFTAYTDPANKASERVLEKNGFIKLDEQLVYDGEPNNVWVKKPEYPVTQKWQKAFEKSQQEHPQETVFIESGRVRQKWGFDCGPATVVNALEALGIKADLEELTESATKILASQGLNIEDTGVPAAIMKVFLEDKYVRYIEKPSDPDSSPEQVAKSINWLKERLKERVVCICPVQTTPDYWLLDAQTGKVAKESEMGEAVRDPVTGGILSKFKIAHTSNEWDGLSQPSNIVESDGKIHGVITATTKEDVDYNGHYVLVVGMMRKDDRTYFITVDPSYKKPQDRSADIDPAYSGIKFIEESAFAKSWHDRSGLGEDFNQYALAIPTRQNIK